jgi:hypothetical protein
VLEILRDRVTFNVDIDISWLLTVRCGVRLNTSAT